MAGGRDRFGRKITPGSQASRSWFTRPPARSSADSPTAPVSGKPTPKTTTIKLSQVASETTGPGGKLLAAAAVLVLGGSLTYAVWHGANGPDPHYLAAKQIVTDYELGRPPQSRNYGHPVYAEALGELAQVDPDSVSAQPADALRVRIEGDVGKFEQRQREQRRSTNHIVERRDTRQKALMTAHLHNVLNPVTQFPECEHEESGGHNYEHD